MKETVRLESFKAHSFFRVFSLQIFCMYTLGGGWELAGGGNIKQRLIYLIMFSFLEAQLLYN